MAACAAYMAGIPSGRRGLVLAPIRSSPRCGVQKHVRSEVGVLTRACNSFCSQRDVETLALSATVCVWQIWRQLQPSQPQHHKHVDQPPHTACIARRRSCCSRSVHSTLPTFAHELESTGHGHGHMHFHMHESRPRLNPGLAVQMSATHFPGAVDASRGAVDAFPGRC